MSATRRPEAQPAAVAALHASAIARVEGLKTTARILAESIRDVMQEIHGGKWRIQIDHDVELVMIVPELDRPASPKLGEVV